VSTEISNENSPALTSDEIQDLRWYLDRYIVVDPSGSEVWDADVCWLTLAHEVDDDMPEDDLRGCVVDIGYTHTEWRPITTFKRFYVSNRELADKATTLARANQLDAIIRPTVKRRP
jgi:hypothetical protein